jgi:hypothetical protein
MVRGLTYLHCWFAASANTEPGTNILAGVIFIKDARSITVVAVGNRKELYD